jgi:hypothetical protein
MNGCILNDARQLGAFLRTRVVSRLTSTEADLRPMRVWKGGFFGGFEAPTKADSLEKSNFIRVVSN